MGNDERSDPSELVIPPPDGTSSPFELPAPTAFEPVDTPEAPREAPKDPAVPRDTSVVRCVPLSTQCHRQWPMDDPASIVIGAMLAGWVIAALVLGASAIVGTLAKSVPDIAAALADMRPDLGEPIDSTIEEILPPPELRARRYSAWLTAAYSVALYGLALALAFPVTRGIRRRAETARAKASYHERPISLRGRPCRGEVFEWGVDLTAKRPLDIRQGWVELQCLAYRQHSMGRRGSAIRETGPEVLASVASTLKPTSVRAGETRRIAAEVRIPSDAVPSMTVAMARVAWRLCVRIPAPSGAPGIRYRADLDVATCDAASPSAPAPAQGRQVIEATNEGVRVTVQPAPGTVQPAWPAVRQGSLTPLEITVQTAQPLERVRVLCDVLCRARYSARAMAPRTEEMSVCPPTEAYVGPTSHRRPARFILELLVPEGAPITCSGGGLSVRWYIGVDVIAPVAAHPRIEVPIHVLPPLCDRER